MTLAHEPAAPYSAGRFRFAVLTLIGTSLIILLGAQVTTTRAGDSVPGWPASFFVPQDRHQLFELGHRWVAGTAGICIGLLMIWCLRTDRRRSVRRLAVLATVLAVVQALIGGLRVKLGLKHHDAVPVVHTLLGQAILAMVTALAVMLSPRWAAPAAARVDAEAEVLRRRSKALVVAVFIQAFLGALQRHMIEDRNWAGVAAHVAGAFVVLWIAAKTVAHVFDRFEADAPLRGPAAALGAALALQLLLGIFALVVTRGDEGYVNAQDATSLIPTLHTLNGALILAFSTALALRAGRFVRPPEGAR
ncbi:MAG TPA: COX15/CtaA family protein [Planctomycetota bacterium]|nr:COX15/CtaA family protein [Planctomycetota bacterium]